MKATEPSYRGVTVDSRFTPLSNIIRHVEGSSWSVNYYSQVLNQDNELSQQQLDRSAVYQQYTLVELLELKVTGPLTGTQDAESKGMHYTGEATVYPGTGLIPNKGDMFLADIGDGRDGVFVVTTAEKKNYLQEACYAIQYELKSYAGDAERADFDRKTVKRTRYVKEFLNYGQNPQILSEDYTLLVDFGKRYRELLAFYLRDFFSTEEQTFLVPGQTNPTYDPFVVKALLDWVSVEDHPLLKRVHQLNVGGDKVMATPSLWDCLSQMSSDYLPMALQKVRLMDKQHWKSVPQFGGVYFSGVQSIVYPLDGRTDVDAAYDQQAAATGGEAYKAGGSRYSTLQRLLPSTDLNGFVYDETTPPALPDIVAVTQDDFYVFTEPFYTNQTPLSSNLERITMAALQGEAIDRQILARLAANAMKWDNLERFYYVPVLLALLKVALRTN